MPARFSSSDLKWIAMGTMLVDHSAVAILYWNGYAADPYWNGIYVAMRLIGRMAFPLFAFLLVQGFWHTKNWKRYAGRLFLTALVSEIPYNFVAGHALSYPKEQNTLILLLIGLLTLKGLSEVEAEIKTEGNQQNGNGPKSQQVSKKQENQRNGNGPTGQRSIQLPGNCRNNRGLKVWGRGFVILAVGLMAAHFTRADYGPMGLLFILAMYFFRGRPQERMMAGAAVFLVLYGDIYGIASWGAFFFINRYNGERGRKLGILPYIFYPAHLVILYMAGVLIHGLHF